MIAILSMNTRFPSAHKTLLTEPVMSLKVLSATSEQFSMNTADSMSIKSNSITTKGFTFSISARIFMLRW